MIVGVDQLRLVRQAEAVCSNIVRPDAAVRCALPLDDIEFFFVRRKCQSIRIDEVGDNRCELAVCSDAEDICVLLLPLGLGSLPFAIDAEERIAKPDRVVGFDNDVVGRIQALALETISENCDLAVLLGARDAPRDGMFAGYQPPLAVARIPIGVIRRAAKNAEALVFSSNFMMRLLGISDQRRYPPSGK